MKKNHFITLAVLLICFAACKKKDGTDPVNNTGNNTPKKSQLELLCQTWTLDQTYEDGTLKTSGGTDQYQYTKQGSYKMLQNGTWTDKGSFDFTSDSASVAMLIGITTTIWALKTLDEKTLKTEFTEGGKKMNYNYKR